MQQSNYTIQTSSFPITSLAYFKAQVLEWCRQFDCCCILDSNQYSLNRYGRYECLVGVGVEAQLSIRRSTKGSAAFNELKTFRRQQPGWLFGHLSYDLKNETEALSSVHPDGVGFPDLHFFRPKHVLILGHQEVRIQSTSISPAIIFFDICRTRLPEFRSAARPVELQSSMSKRRYIDLVKATKEHIRNGDLYEMNLCQQFFAEHYPCDPPSVFGELNSLSKAPFSSFYKIGMQYLLCASPERFLQKRGRQLLSQPIKGTIGRSQNTQQDARLARRLAASQKDRAEHVMIVDLVRNDLARSCQAGSVKVEELFGIYRFEQVHHMISTISGTLREDVHFIDAIKNAFPMGSMTGAPKVMAMQLIEQYELSRRSLYSGALGYISPDDDFDFNVVIRSLQYNAGSQYLSYLVGGAIVYDSVARKEYEECLLKAKAMLRILKATINTSRPIASLAKS